MSLAHNLNIPINLPAPKVKPAPTVTPTPKPPSPLITKVSAAVTKSITVIEGLISDVQKLVAMAQNAEQNAINFGVTTIQSQTITIIVKRGGVTVFQQKISPLGPVS